MTLYRLLRICAPPGLRLPPGGEGRGTANCARGVVRCNRRASCRVLCAVWYMGPRTCCLLPAVLLCMML